MQLTYQTANITKFQLSFPLQTQSIWTQQLVPFGRRETTRWPRWLD